MGKWFSILIIMLSIILPNSAVNTVSAEGSIETLVINEMQTGGCDVFVTEDPPKCSMEDGQKEFVELRNLLPIDIWLDDWRLEYVSASGATVTELVVLNGHVKAGGNILISYDGYRPKDVVPDLYFAKTNASGLLAKSGGHIRLTKDSVVMDLVGWGSAAATDAWPKVPVINPEYSVQRLQPNDPLYDTLGKFSTQTYTTSPVGDGLVIVSEEDPDAPTEEPEEPRVPEEAQSCEGIIVSEILPNPEGVDTGKEFVELHNPTSQIISLKGCAIGLSGTSKTYSFVEDISLSPGEYRAFYDEVSDISLPNAAGGEVVIINGNTEYPFLYPKDMKDSEAWALIGSTWQATDRPTPGEENIPMTPVVDSSDELESSGLDPCPVGKFRNPETNRCKNIAILADALIPCNPGQVRNTETNRCRSVMLASSTLASCKPGQERNPATNRCRKVLAAKTALKPCDDGEERNPETNRCRKATAKLASAAAATDKSNDESKNLINYGILGLVGTAVVGYGVYEYRNDIRTKLAGIKNRFFATKSGE